VLLKRLKEDENNPRWIKYKDLKIKVVIAKNRYKAERARIRICEIQANEKKSGKPDQEARQLFFNDFGYAVLDSKID